MPHLPPHVIIPVGAVCHHIDTRLNWECVLIAMPVGSIFAALGLLVLGATLWEAGRVVKDRARGSTLR